MVVFKKHDSVPSARYSSVCNVLRQWRIWLIPTYRVYRLYDNYYTCKSLSLQFGLSLGSSSVLLAANTTHVSENNSTQIFTCSPLLINSAKFSRQNSRFVEISRSRRLNFGSHSNVTSVRIPSIPMLTCAALNTSGLLSGETEIS